MKAITIIVTTLLLSLYITQCKKYDRVLKNESNVTTNSETDSDSANFDQEKALADLRKEIEGWENDPSENVYLNIQTLNKVPAGEMLTIMDTYYSKALGVTCLHCHDSKDWSSDKKAAKTVAREMSKMVSQINDNILANIESLGDREGNVTCNTCHRGDKKPLLNTDGF